MPGPDLNDSELFHQQCYIDGQWVDADSGATLEVDNPATGDILGTVPNLGRDETRRAIEAADRAFGTWKRMTAAERGDLLRRWHDLMMVHQEDLGRLMTLEQGKPLAEA